MTEATQPVSRAYYSAPVPQFIAASADAILGQLTRHSEFDVNAEQRNAWLEQVALLKRALGHLQRGLVCFEFVVPRLGRRIDALLLLEHLVFVMEFKVGPDEFTRSAREQVWDYALDLKNFHETSHDAQIVPILVATAAPVSSYVPRFRAYKDGVFYPEEIGADNIRTVIDEFLRRTSGNVLAAREWEAGSYRPTPTIIEAAKTLYAQHSIKDLARSDAGAKNLARTSNLLSKVIEAARNENRKALCLVTGVPGAGKTLVGLDVATRHMDVKSELHSVYLSGNAPLVAILREALTRDQIHRDQLAGKSVRKGEVRREVESFIQNVHHFRDDCLKDDAPPHEHVAIFDEAQRAWNLRQTANFMARKKKRLNFDKSEPDFLISCLDRHKNWAVVICLVGGGQEINTGEAGISEWVEALQRNYPDWQVHVSSRLQDEEYGAGRALSLLRQRPDTHFSDDLHLAVSMRSFRAENLSNFVKRVLDIDTAGAAAAFSSLAHRYPVRLTRDVQAAKQWLRQRARGSERFGMVVSSQAQRLKPLAIDVRVSTDPVHWFLDDVEDVRSSYFLEDVATEFDVQGLELDWACVVWDADFRFTDSGWQHHSFVGSHWNRIRSPERQAFQKNAYRVLLTRARQGMVVVVPEGNVNDATRLPAFYDGTYDYLRSVGLQEI